MNIILHQHLNGNKDPVLTITLTNHESYMKHGKAVAENIAILMIEKWLKGKLHDNPKEGVESDAR